MYWLVYWLSYWLSYASFSPFCVIPESKNFKNSAKYIIFTFLAFHKMLFLSTWSFYMQWALTPKSALSPSRASGHTPCLFSNFYLTVYLSSMCHTKKCKKKSFSIFCWMEDRLVCVEKSFFIITSENSENLSILQPIFSVNQLTIVNSCKIVNKWTGKHSIIVRNYASKMMDWFFYDLLSV